MTEWRTDWIIAIANSAVDGVVIYRFFGDRHEVKEKLLELLNNDKKNDVDMFEYGTESVDEVEDTGFYDLNAYATYCDYHIDYTAKEFCEIDRV